MHDDGARPTVSRRTVLKAGGLGGLAASVGACSRSPQAGQPVEATSTGPPVGSRLWGAYVQDSGSDGSLYELDSLRRLEASLGRRFPIVSGFAAETITGRFLSNMQTLAAEGRSTLISYDIRWPLAEIAAGAHDSDLRSTATALKNIGGPVKLRPFAEMNGDWSPWSVANAEPSVSSHSEWIAAWRHLVGIFRAAAATNVQFVWCPNSVDEPKSNRLENYWPGAEWVDLLGVDAYNWGNPWRTHRQILDDAYRRIIALSPTHNLWLCEFGCKEPTTSDGAEPLRDRSKANWITDLMSDRGYPRLAACIWFSVKKERDWRVDSTPESLAAFRAGLPA